MSSLSKIWPTKTERELVFHSFLLLFAANIILVSIAIFLYNGNFDGLKYPYSYAGDYRTVDGSLNTFSMYVYSLDMAISGLIMLFLAAHALLAKRAATKFLLYLMAGFGFLIASISPDDIRHSSHVLGSALAIASLWIISTYSVFEIRTQVQPIKFASLQAIIQIPIFAYAGTYFLNIDPLSYILQKFALLGLCISLLYSVYLSSHSKS